MSSDFHPTGNSFIDENDSSVAILALLGIPLSPEDFLVGLTCAQVTVIGLGSGSWWVIYDGGVNY